MSGPGAEWDAALAEGRFLIQQPVGGGKPVRTYVLMMVGGYAVGLPLGWYELQHIYAGQFSPIAFSEADRTYQFSRLAMVIGHLGLALLVIRLVKRELIQGVMAQRAGGEIVVNPEEGEVAISADGVVSQNGEQMATTEVRHGKRQ